MIRKLHPLSVTGVTLVMAVVQAAAQAPHSGHASITAIPLELLQRPVHTRDGIGVAREVASWIEASRSFHAALQVDRKLAMAHLGLSYALGELGSFEPARKASEASRDLASNISRREQVRIALRNQQLDVLGGLADASAYRRATDSALAQCPNDVELLLQRGLAEDLAAAGPLMSSGGTAVRYYERAIAIAPDQFAAHHYLIHVYENSGRIDRSLEHAERESGDWTLATELANEMRQHDAAYARTHYALALAAEQRGDRVAAARSYGEAVQAWSDADADLPELKHARSRRAALNTPAR